MATQQETFMSTRDVAEWLAVTEAQVRFWVREKGMPCLRAGDGGVMRFRRSEVEEWLRANGTRGSDDA